MTAKKPPRKKKAVIDARYSSAIFVIPRQQPRREAVPVVEVIQGFHD